MSAAAVPPGRPPDLHREAGSARAGAAAAASFVVLCDARSGSGYLCDCLNRHPELACHHELFNAELGSSRYGVLPFHRTTRTDPLEYLHAMRAQTRLASGARLVGFKLHFRHHPALLEHVLGDPREQVILLSRRDKLAQWASYRLARITSQWSHPGTDDDTHPVRQVPFKLLRYTLYLVHQHGWERRVLRQRPECLHVRYEDILEPGALAPLLRRLGVDPQIDLRPKSRRQFRGGSTYERFTNPRWAAVGSRIGAAVAWLVRRLGATALVRRFSGY